MSRTPAPEVIVDAATVVRLVDSQCPQFAGLPVELLGHGWDNWLFRLGDRHIVRLPRRALAVQLLAHELQCLPLLAPTLPIPVPVPVFAGTGDASYPWPWLIAPWFAGESADAAPLNADQAVRLAQFLRALHQPDKGAAPGNDHRGIPLSRRTETARGCWDVQAQRGDRLDPALAALWDQACHAPLPDERVWLHGDLHYANVLVQHGAFTAIVDWGDVCGGDPATDLAAFWGLFDDPVARQAGLTAYGADAATRLRAMGWALSFGSVLLSSGLADNPRHADSGRATLRRLRDDLRQSQ